MIQKCCRVEWKRERQGWGWRVICPWAEQEEPSASALDGACGSLGAACKNREGTSISPLSPGIRDSRLCLQCKMTHVHAVEQSLYTVNMYYSFGVKELTGL